MLSLACRELEWERLMTHLTPAELQVLLLMAEELSNREIADRLVITTATLKKHRQHLYEKTGTNNPVALVGWARRNLRVQFLEMERLLQSEDRNESMKLPRPG
jgi:DNA-binding CsgD family transcriptional regulator